jgi:hypothetical protein
MYLQAEIILRALEELEQLHPFYGITFLVFKKYEIPIGTTKEISIDSLERAFMDEYYKPFEESSWYYRVFRPNNPNKQWLDAKYPGGGSQSTRTRGPIAQSLIHNTDEPLLWGWKQNYVDILSERLYRGKKIPVFYLATWLYRQRKWDNNTTPQDIIDTFINEFNITHDEIKELFDVTVPSNLDKITIFDTKPVQVKDLIPIIGIPPDLPGEGGGILSYLELQGVGPAESLRFEPNRRINLITGDNGLGKTFLLDTSWWALTGQWIDYPADPTNTPYKQATISYRVSGEYKESGLITIEYDRATFSWPTPSENKAIPSLLVYARADNSFAVWDPAQHYQQTSSQISISQAFHFSPDDVWFGLEDKVSRRSICEGLLRDWVTWQSTRADEFETLTQILKYLSPKDLGELRPGQPTRVPGEKRLIPTLSLPYGDVAVIYASAGMRRIMSLAYLLVWAWSEHKAASKLANQVLQRRMVILIDELEAHLHPKWQRLILPALVEVQNELSRELEVQFLIATHSPFIMVSAEPVFNIDVDKIFNLDFAEHDLFTKRVILKELPFVKFGVIDSWLAEVFGVEQPRHNVSGGTALEDAKQLQLQDDPDPRQIREVHNRLVKYLAADDEFWPRWLFFAEEHGVET